MNLNAYDNVENKFEQGTWINPNFKRLYSTDIKYRKYAIFLKRYNTELNITEYYLALTDELPKNCVYHFTIYTKNNILKINLKNIWNDTPFINYKDKVHLNYKLVQKESDGEVYYLDI